MVLPAYGCPDLVAATLQAGGVPLLVDTLVGSPFIDPARLAQVDAPVAAVVGVHFLGMAQDLAALGVAAENLGAVLIEDSAQSLPAVRDSLPAAELAIYSFGRGKPAGALGGGALRTPPAGRAVCRAISRAVRWNGCRWLCSCSAPPTTRSSVGMPMAWCGVCPAPDSARPATWSCARSNPWIRRSGPSSTRWSPQRR